MFSFFFLHQSHQHLKITLITFSHLVSHPVRCWKLPAWETSSVCQFQSLFKQGRHGRRLRLYDKRRDSVLKHTSDLSLAKCFSMQMYTRTKNNQPKIGDSKLSRLPFPPSGSLI